MFSWIWYLGSSGLDAPRRTLSADLIYGIMSQRSKTMVMELNPNTGSDRFWTTPAKFFNSRKWFSFSDWSNAIPPIMYADEIESCTCGSDTDSWTRVSKQLQLYLPFSPCPRREIVQKVLQLVNDGWRALGQRATYNHRGNSSCVSMIILRSLSSGRAFFISENVLLDLKNVV